jgi:hypothetical protein
MMAKKINPRDCVNWAQGYYCCGIENKTLTLGYVPKEVKK